VRDDRGKRVSILGPQRRIRIFRRVVSAIIVLLAIFILSGIVGDFQTFTANLKDHEAGEIFLLKLAGRFCCGFSVPVLFVALTTPISERFLRGISKRSARCPACAFSLQAAHAGKDGCTVCPECGAAWRLPDADRGERPTS
jgi:hypothetical protein